MPERDDLTLIRDLAIEGGRIALDYFGDDPKVWMKPGDSPVSEADYAVDTFLKEKLRAARPDYGWLSEETADDDAARFTAKRTFVVDPIDGTRGFLAGSKRWCVSVAIVEDGRPTEGVLACPALEDVFAAQAGQGATLNGETLECPDPGEALPVAGPMPLIRAMEQERPVTRLPHVPSLAYRIAMVATGSAGIAFARSGPKDWDIAAADLIVAEAGGALLTPAGTVPTYNKRDTKHPGLIAGPNALREEMLVFAARHMG
ncbi:MAG: 3'(2'),5'-bisphosphate nucleotidase CysQ [Pseudomonadota bacterium]